MKFIRNIIILSCISAFIIVLFLLLDNKTLEFSNIIYKNFNEDAIENISYNIDLKHEKDEKVIFYHGNDPVLLSDLKLFFKSKENIGEKYFENLSQQEFLELINQYIDMISFANLFDREKNIDNIDKETYKRQEKLLINRLKANYYINNQKIKNSPSKKITILENKIKDKYNFQTIFTLQILLVKNSKNAWQYYNQLKENPKLMNDYISRYSFKLSSKQKNSQYILNNYEIKNEAEKVILPIAMNLKIGEIHSPVKINEGYIIIRLINKSLDEKLDDDFLFTQARNFHFKNELNQKLRKYKNEHIFLPKEKENYNIFPNILFMQNSEKNNDNEKVNNEELYNSPKNEDNNIDEDSID